MSEEKIKILKMLQEGKISSADAEKLLSMSDKGDKKSETKSETKSDTKFDRDFSGYKPNTPPKKTDFARSIKHEADEPSKPAPGFGGHEFPKFEDKHDSRAGFDQFGDDLSKKIEVFMKDFEPKLKKFSDKFVEKTVEIADSISKSVETERKKDAGKRSDDLKRTDETRSTRAASTVSLSKELNFELPVKDKNSELKLATKNGGIQIKGYNGKEINAKVFFKTKFHDSVAKLIAVGSKFVLDYDENRIDSVSVEMYIPYSMFSYIQLSASNGNVNVSGIEAAEADICALNGNLEIQNVKNSIIKIEAQNSKDIRLSGMVCDQAELDSSNGNLYLNDNFIKNFRVSGFNSAVNISQSSFNFNDDILWTIESSNNRIAAILPNATDFGYYIKALTSINSVKIGLTSMNFINSDASFAEAKSVNYDDMNRKVRISLETSNAQIVIN